MAARNFRFTETFAEQLEGHAEYKSALVEIMKEVLDHPERFPTTYLGRRRAEHNSPGLVCFFSISEIDGSITFELLVGPNTPLGP
jgi:hypothetical protein